MRAQTPGNLVRRHQFEGCSNFANSSCFDSRSTKDRHLPRRHSGESGLPKNSNPKPPPNLTPSCHPFFRRPLAATCRQMRDPHQALKHEQMAKGRATTAGVDFFLVRSQWGKEDFGFSLHAAPNQFSTSGVQTTDFLASLGFERAACPFTGRLECYTRWVNDGFAMDQFVETLIEDSPRSSKQPES